MVSIWSSNLHNRKEPVYVSYGNGKDSKKQFLLQNYQYADHPYSQQANYGEMLRQTFTQQ